MAAKKVESVKQVESVRRVKVLPPFRVVHDATAYSDGQTAEVPEAVAEQWLLNHWVTEAE
jgi:hypothetical protein